MLIALRVFVCLLIAMLTAGAVGAQDPGATSSLTLVSGILAGQAVSSSNHNITVSPGAPISGFFIVQINSSFASNGNLPLAATPSWGNHSTSYMDAGGFPSPAAGLQRSITVNLTAPTTPGTYYITAAYRGEISAAYVMSATNFVTGAVVWNNDDDIADWPAETIATINQNGRAQVKWLVGNEARYFWVPATAVVVSVLDPSDSGANSYVRISSGTLAGQSVSQTNRVISVRPEAAITGSVVFQVKSAYTAGSPIAMGVTPTWGTHSTSYIDAGTFVTPTDGSFVTVPINYQAPSAAGTYHLIAAFRPEFSAAQVMSATNWTVASPAWDDGNDIAGWPQSAIDTANANGTVLVPYTFSSGNVPVYVPSTAIQVVVSDDPGTSSSLQLISGSINGQSLSAFNRTISVDAGAAITGTFNVRIDSTWPITSTMAFGVTPTWGPHSTSYNELASFSSPVSALMRSIPVNMTAPNTPGTYYIIAAYRSEANAGLVMSATNSTVGSPAWGNGDDIADWSAAMIDTANQNGRTLANYLFASGNIPQNVPAAAIRVVVGGGGSALRFVPLTPCRVADTRLAVGGLGGPILGAGETRSFDIDSSACSVPSTAAAYSLNVTVVPSGALEYLSIWPAGQSQPLVSTLNSLDGRIKANAAIVPAGANGAVNVYVTNPTHVVLDINGYFVASNTAETLAYYPIAPCRIADTRLTAGAFGGPALSAGITRDFFIPGSGCSIPISAKAYSLNMTAVPAGPLGYLSTWPTGMSQPLVSTLNSPTGAITANAAIVPAGINGGVSVFATNDTDLVIDINGYFAAADASGLSFYVVSPCRVSDTRTASGTFGGPTVQAGQARSYPLPSSSCGLPLNARAYSLNATVVPQSTLGFLTLWPTDGQMPLVSTLNALDGSITSNAAIVTASSGGAVDAYVTNVTDLVLDVNGYFAP